MADPAIGKDLYTAICTWIPQRRATIKELEMIVNKISSKCKVANGFKFAGASAGLIASVAGLALDMVSILAPGGVAPHLLIVASVAGGIGFAGLLTSFLADLVKADTTKQIEMVDDDFEAENDEYQTVISNFGRLNVTIIDKNHINIQQESLKYPAGQTASKLAVTALNLNNCMHVYLAEHISTEAADSVAQFVVRSLPALPSPHAVTTVGIKAADTATNSTCIGTFLKEVFNNTTKAMVETAGKVAAEKALETSKKGVTAIAMEAKAASARAARRVGRGFVQETTTQLSSELTKTSLGIPSDAIGKVLGGSLPILNLGTAALGSYEVFTTGRGIAYGTKAEGKLRRKIRNLKGEANKIIDRYNPIASNNSPKLPAIKHRF